MSRSNEVDARNLAPLCTRARRVVISRVTGQVVRVVLRIGVEVRGAVLSSRLVTRVRGGALAMDQAGGHAFAGR